MEASKARLVNSNVSVFSSNCVGGVICHDLGIRFNSPTVNLFMVPADFVKFASDPETFLSQPVERVDTGTSYPVGRLGEITLHFMHYASFTEAEAAWKRRCTRVDLDNSRWILVDRDGLDEETAQAFEAIPREGKVLLSHRGWEGVGCCFSCAEWVEAGGRQTVDLCAFAPEGILESPQRAITDSTS